MLAVCPTPTCSTTSNSWEIVQNKAARFDNNEGKSSISGIKEQLKWPTLQQSLDFVLQSTKQQSQAGDPRVLQCSRKLTQKEVDMPS